MLNTTQQLHNWALQGHVSIHSVFIEIDLTLSREQVSHYQNHTKDMCSFFDYMKVEINTRKMLRKISK